jgi:hypothetical protein
LNYQDLHFPYYHKNMKKVFIKEPHTEETFFQPQNFRDIQRQYGNAAHHLDQALRELFDALKSRGIIDRTIVVITGDHPDSFYENGLMGHGWAVDQPQRRIPLFIVNGQGAYDYPLGQDEIVDVVLNSVEKPPGSCPASFRADPSKSVFVLTGPLAEPREIAWLSLDGLETYSFMANRYQSGAEELWRAPGQLSEPDYSIFKRLVNRWESEHWKRSSKSAGKGAVSEQVSD